MRILLVDDSKVQVFATKENLEMRSTTPLRINTVSTPEEVISCEPREYDIVIIDHNLFNGYNYDSKVAYVPFSSGYEILRHWIETGYNGIAILITGDHEFVDSKTKHGLLERLFGGQDEIDQTICFLKKGDGDLGEAIFDCIKNKGLVGE